MSDLIDRDKTLEAIQKHFNPGGNEIENWLVAETLIGVGVVISTMPAVEPDIVRCGECKHNPKRSWFGCPMSGLNERQRPETAWCWKGERENNGGSD